MRKAEFSYQACERYNSSVRKRFSCTGYVEEIELPNGLVWQVGYRKDAKGWQAIDILSGWLVVEGKTRKACQELINQRVGVYYRTFLETQAKAEHYQREYVDPFNAMEVANDDS